MAVKIHRPFGTLSILYKLFCRKLKKGCYRVAHDGKYISPFCYAAFKGEETKADCTSNICYFKNIPNYIKLLFWAQHFNS